MQRNGTRETAAEAAQAPAGKVSVLEELRHKKKMRRLRRITLLVLVLALALAYVTGLAGASFAAAKDAVDSLRIALTPAAGFPVQTGISEVYQLEELSGGFAELGPESCVVYSAGGTRLRSIQPGYARPAIAVGKTRFAIYNRSGTELRVESRTQTLYTRTFSDSILLAGMANSGKLAVVTENGRYVAELTVWSPMMEQLLTWDMTDAEGTPLCLAFAEDDRRLAVLSLTADAGQTVSKLYVVDTQKGVETLLASAEGSLPLRLEWQSGNELLAVYDDHAALYSVSKGTETARFDYMGETLAGVAVCNRKTALLFRTGSASQLHLLDSSLSPVFHMDVTASTGLSLTRTAVYLITDSAVECFSLAGEYQWYQSYDTRPLAMLDARELLLFTGNAAEILAAPEE